jgi:hypothetical protein
VLLQVLPNAILEVIKLALSYYEKNRISRGKLNHFLYKRIIDKKGDDVILNLKDNSKKIISKASDLLKDEKNREKAKSFVSSALKQAKKLKKK